MRMKFLKIGMPIILMLSAVSVTVPIVVIKQINDANQIYNSNESNLGKLSYDGKIFESLDAVADYYLIKNNAVSSDFYFGNAFNAIYDQTNGFLDISQLYPNDYSKISNAYPNGFGGYEKSKEKALSSFINETKIVTKYTDYHGGYFYEYDEAAASLAAKTKSYDVVYSDVKLSRDQSFFINPTNEQDQNFLKWSALNYIDKPESPFGLLYYVNDPKTNEYIPLGDYEIQKTFNTIGSELKTAMGDVIQDNLKFSTTLKGRGTGNSDFDLGAYGWKGDDLVIDWQHHPNRGGIPWNSRKHITFNNLSIWDALDLRQFYNNDKEFSVPATRSKFYNGIYDGGKLDCCVVNTVAHEKVASFSNERTIIFAASWNTRWRVHDPHGSWFGAPGDEVGLYGHNGNYMNFDIKISPSYYVKADGSRIYANAANYNAIKMDIIKHAVEKLYASLSKIETTEKQEFLKLAVYNVYKILEKNLVNKTITGSDIFADKYSTILTELLDGFKMETPDFTKEDYFIAGDVNKTRIDDKDSFKSLISSLDKWIKVRSDTQNSNGPEIINNGFLIEWYFNIIKTSIPVITYNGRPLYSVDLFNKLTQEKIEQSLIIAKNNILQSENVNNFFTKFSLQILNNDRDKVYQSLGNVSQNVTNNEDSINKFLKYEISRNENKINWNDNLDPKDVINLPNIWINAIGNKIANMKPNMTDETLINQIIYQYQYKGNMITQTVKDDIPILYDESGVLDLYISAYLGNSSDMNVALNNHNLPLYNDDKTLLNGINNLGSLTPSKVRLIIDPYGQPIQLESEPGSDGFFNSLENTLINAGYEFVIWPSEELMYYENELISSKLQLIYSLTVENKTLNFIDYYKLRTYVKSILSLEIKYV